MCVIIVVCTGFWGKPIFSSKGGGGVDLYKLKGVCVVCYSLFLVLLDLVVIFIIYVIATVSFFFIIIALALPYFI